MRNKTNSKKEDGSFSEPRTNMYNYLPTDNEHIHIYGRCVKQTPLALFWTASGIEFTTDSSEIWIDVECDFTDKEEYLRFEMDGVLLARFMVMKGRHEYCILRGFGGDELKNIRVLLEAQPMGDDEDRKLLIHKISCDRLLQPLWPKDLKIEFVGDSLTSGEGLTGTSATNVWCTGIYGLTGHYAVRTADYFNADFSIVSQSGWGIYSGWDNNMTSRIPDIYTQICGVVKGEKNTALGAAKEHDFDAWQPDFIVVNLATNDGGASNSPEWTDPLTGKVYKQSRDENDRLDKPSKENFCKASYDFMKLIRKKNPEAEIIWAYGMCDHFMEEYILEVIGELKREGENRICYVSLPSAKEDQLGAHGHPGEAAHLAAADVLIEAIKKMM